MITQPPLAFSVSEGYLNVFQSGAFAGAIPILQIPPEMDLPFSPSEELCFVPEDELMFA